MTAEESLVRLFESDPDAPDYYQRNPGYALNVLLHVPPHWPPLEEVWAVGEEVPDTCAPGTGAAEGWPEAWELLQKLHRQYQNARGRD